jgi:hypothetical protein
MFYAKRKTENNNSDPYFSKMSLIGLKNHGFGD